MDAETSKLSVSQMFGQAMADLGNIPYNNSTIVMQNPNPLDDMYVDLPDVTDDTSSAAAAGIDIAHEVIIFHFISQHTYTILQRYPRQMRAWRKNLFSPDCQV